MQQTVARKIFIVEKVSLVDETTKILETNIFKRRNYSSRIIPLLSTCSSACQYSETCIRQSPLGPDQLVVIQRWPTYKDCIEIS